MRNGELNEPLAERLNRTAVAPEDLYAVMEEADRISGASGRRSFEVGVIAASTVCQGDFDLVTAIVFRMQALAAVLDGVVGAPGWAAKRDREGGIPTREELIAAAATEPLVMNGNEILFVRESLLNRALSLAVSEGSA